MNQPGIRNKNVLIITGVSPETAEQFQYMGMVSDPIILLISMSGKNSYQSSIPSLGAAALGGYLRQQGMPVTIADYFFDEVPFTDADIIGISSTFMSFEDVKRIADESREKNPGATIVLGGPISWSVAPKELMYNIPSLDHIVLQEGEQTFTQLIEAIRNRDDISLVPSVISRYEGELRESGHGKPVDIDAIPMPAWDLMGTPSERRFPVLPIETSRGCPYHCAYCSEVSYWGKPVRYRSIESVVEEIRYNADKYGITTFRFADSCFSSPAERCASVCDAIYEQCITRGVPVKWSSYARFENISQELLDKMKRSGCVALDFGLESGSTEILRDMGRGYAEDRVVDVARRARELDIITNFNLVVGFPGETRETVQDTIDLLNKAKPDTFTTFSFFVAPRTKAYSDHARYGLDGAGLSWKHDTMTSEGAAVAMRAVADGVTGATSFPAGEYAALYLTSVGYSSKEIRDFYKATGRLVKGADDKATIAYVKKVNDSVSHLCYRNYGV